MLKHTASACGPPQARVLMPCPSPPPARWAWAAVLTHPILWLEEALLLPPGVPGRLHILRAVGVGHGATDIWGERRRGLSEAGEARVRAEGTGQSTGVRLLCRPH